jgi:hypothetical protein
MTTYTDEVNIYNPEAVGDGIDSAAQTATNYIQADETGIRIANANPDTATTYQHQTATSTEFVVDDASVAEFGGSGARIGAADAGHLSLSEDSVTITNADGVQAFNVDLDSGVAYSYATEPAETKASITDIKATTSGNTLNYRRVTDVSGAVSGSTITGSAGQVLLLQMASDESATFNLSSATISSGINVSGNNSKTLYVRVPKKRIATAGTSETTTGAATGIRWGVNTRRTLDVVAKWAYDAAAGTLTETVSVTFKAESTLYYHFGQFKRTLRTLQYRVSSTAPAFSLGTRALDSTIGAFSAIVGEDLHATQPNQVAIGKHNLEDTTGDYALIIGNGTADDARSNALAVTWDGSTIAQGWAGVIQMFAGSTPPAGWLLCDGSAVSRTEYATLYAAIGDTWGAGDGSTTFNLPDLRGRAPIGAGTGSGLTARTLGGTVG